ncbi:MAG TPA: cytochrome P450 [Thermoanaerobaculia bacterium]|nr:cytochrome P450 [Thermoanaerobaculia bacterium]
MRETEPSDPIAAVTHPNPYPYYQRLAAERPFERDERLGVWVAASAEAVNAVLTSNICRVRPTAEPVPKALLGSSAGEIFGQLVRMNDGPVHRALKGKVQSLLESMDASGPSREWARRLPPDPAVISFRLPAYVIGNLLGVEDLPRLADLVSDFAPALAPGSTPEQVERGREAAGHLLDLIPDANRIGFLFQAYDSTAGLIGNTLLALASEPGDVHQTLLKVLRTDPPVQNTRRFVAEDGIVAGRALKEGDTVLVLLVGTPFGTGPHACPGERLAVTIAQAGIEALLEAGIDLQRLTRNVTYRPSANVRIPILAPPPAG